MLKLLKIIIASAIVAFACQGFSVDRQSGWIIAQDGGHIESDNPTVGTTEESDQTDETNMAIERQIKEKARKRFPQRSRAASGEESRRVPK